MDNRNVINEDYIKLFNNIINRECFEDKALVTLTSETLQKLNINLERLPRQSQTILDNVADSQNELQLQSLYPIAISLYKSRELSEKLYHIYELLELNLKNIELQIKIHRNNRFLAKMKKDLENSRQSLSNQDPNPENINKYIRQLKQKLSVYEDNYERVKTKYSSLNIPESILPKSLITQVASLQTLSEEAMSFKAKADDVKFMNETKAILSKLRR
ncbi:uncharacterized protein LOC112054154 [Bicyclus anynana]|uniref:Uncharacterized protein LOC112054154 n=1 Tax=Bicyclus anynana TaxID=110368 RepID=A0ABM3LU53_BICAN|nr:uncharacterized protein LOC112054154 [Bicyclus anynana]